MPRRARAARERRATIRTRALPAVGLLLALAAGAALWLAARTDETSPDAGERTAASDRTAPLAQSSGPSLRAADAPARVSAATAGPAAPAAPAATAPRTLRALEGVLRARRRVPGLRLWAVALDGDPQARTTWVDADEQGRFRFEDLPPGRYRLVAKAGPLAQEFEVAASLEPGAAAAILDVPTQALPGRPSPATPPAPGAPGQVRLLGHDGGTVSRARVTVRMPGGSFGGELRVTDGAFVRPGVEGWTWAYEVTQPADVDGRPLPYGPLTQRFDDAGIEPATLRLPPERVIEGQLLDPDERGAAGVELWALPDAPATGLVPHATATTAPDGTFRLGNLADGAYRVTALAGPPLVPAGEEWSVRAGETRVLLRLRPPAPR